MIVEKESREKPRMYPLGGGTQGTREQNSLSLYIYYLFHVPLLSVFVPFVPLSVKVPYMYCNVLQRIANHTDFRSKRCP